MIPEALQNVIRCKTFSWQAFLSGSYNSQREPNLDNTMDAQTIST